MEFSWGQTFHPGIPTREARAVPSAFGGDGVALCYAKGVPAATGRKRLGRGVSKADVTKTFDLVCKAPSHWQHMKFFFFLLSSLELSATQIYEP